MVTSAGVRRAQIRWRLASPVLRAAVQASLVAAVVGAFFAAMRVGDLVHDTAASVLVAVVFGVATVLQLRQSQRRQHTVELITGFQSSDALSAADSWMAARIAAHRPVGADLPPDDERHVVALLDYYEFLSSLALRGLVDAGLLLSLRGATMWRSYQICATYVEDRRVSVGADLYRSYHAFVAEYARRKGMRTSGWAAPAGVPAQTAASGSEPAAAE